MGTRRRHWLSVCAQQVSLSLKHRRGRHGATLLSIAAATALWTVMNMRLQTPNLSVVEFTKLQWYAIASLLLCVFGICQSILLAVSERTKEIGTLKCLGASDGFVIAFVLIESAVLACLGSLFGALLGWAVHDTMTHRSAQDPLGALLQSLAVGLGSTLVAATVPAIYAGRIPAAVAMRSEI